MGLIPLIEVAIFVLLLTVLWGFCIQEVIRCKRKKYGVGEAVSVGFMATLLGGLFYFMICFLIINTVCSAIMDTETIENRTQNIVSLQQDSSINGQFFMLGSGYINEERQYIYFVVRNDGGYFQDTVPTKDTLIFEQEEIENPHLSWDVKVRSVHPWLKNGTINGNQVITRSSSYCFYVPKGTIIKEFSL